MSRFTEIFYRAIGREGYEDGKEEGRAKDLSISTGVTRAGLQFFLPASSEFFRAEKDDPDRAGRPGEPMCGTSEFVGSLIYDAAPIGVFWAVNTLTKDPGVATAAGLGAKMVSNAAAHTAAEGVRAGVDKIKKRALSLHSA